MKLINLAVITLLLIVIDRNRVSAATCDPTNWRHLPRYHSELRRPADDPQHAKLESGLFRLDLTPMGSL